MMFKQFNLKQILLLSLAIACLSLVFVGSAFANESLLYLQDDDTQWPMVGGDYDLWRYSELDQINTENVGDLEVAWTFSTGILDSHEAEPLVVGNTMYIVTPKPNTVYALDLARDAEIKWIFRPEQRVEEAVTVACCGAQTRGLAYADNKIFFNSLDGQVFSLNAATGEVVWSAQNADLSIGETNTTMPLVAGDNVIVGIAGGEYGARGHLTAYDINTGEREWRYYNTGPNDEMGIGPHFQPFYADDQVENPGLDTWYGDSWERGGGTVWGWISYDSELGYFYYGTSNCAPWNPDYRWDPENPDPYTYSNKYCAAVMARDAETGELIWAHSLTPADMWDYDEPGELILVDLDIDGDTRKALVKFARNGFVYVMDRVTGEILIEPEPFGHINWASGVDMETGRPNINPDKIVRTGEMIEVCPGTSGLKNFQPGAYSPRTGLFYMNSVNVCMELEMYEVDYEPGQRYTGARTRQFPDQGGHLSEVIAWNVHDMDKVWGIKDEVRNRNGLLASAGDVVFFGTQDGWFKAADAESGEVLYSFRTGAGFATNPITYVGPDGKQYVAIIAGARPSDIRDPDQPVDAAWGDVGRYTRTAGMLYVFGL